MKKWDWIFFDADETLFTFDAFTGLQRMFLDYSITFTAEDFQDYQAVNKPLWVDYQNGAITSLQLQHARFLSWAERLNVPLGRSMMRLLMRWQKSALRCQCGVAAEYDSWQNENRYYYQRVYRVAANPS